jgi:hypothetical protein
MGSPISQVASSTQPQGKGFASPQPQTVKMAWIKMPSMPIHKGFSNGSRVNKRSSKTPLA